MKTTPFLESLKLKLAPLGEISTRAMTGGYLVYLNGVYVGAVDDDLFYLKKFDENADFLKNSPEKSMYVGAKPSYVVDVDDVEFLLRATYLTFTGAVNAANKKKPLRKK